MSTDSELAELEQKIAAEAEKLAQKPEGNPPEPENVSPTPDPVQPEAGTSVNPDAETFDAKQWAEKKGWKSAEDAAKSMRSLEQEFHRKNEELSRLKAQQQGYAPPENPYAPPAQPPYPYAPPQQGYMPPPNPYQPQMYAPQQAYNPQPRITEEQAAAEYNLSVEDFRKVMRLSRDVAEVQNARTRAEMQRFQEQVQVETAKSSDMAAVLQDPAFHNPDVQREMHDYLSKNPTVMTRPNHLSVALKESLATIGRRNAMRGATGQPSTLPSNPPQGLQSNASNFSGRKNGGPISNADAEKMTAAELEKVLKGMGAVKTYEDLA